MACLQTQYPSVTAPRTRSWWSRSSVRRVLACLTPSSRGAALAAEASMVARLFRADLQIVHAGADTPQARQRLQNMLASVSAPADTPITMASGPPEQVTCDIARQNGVDLIIAGVTDHHATLTQHASTIAGRIVVGSPCHVLLVPSLRPRPAPFRRVMASIDFDKPSLAMLDLAIQWARDSGAQQVDVVHEYDPRAFYGQADGQPLTGSLWTSRRDLAAQRSKQLDQLLAAYQWYGLKHSKVCLRSNTGCDAVWHARTIGADLLCLPITPRRLAFWGKLMNHRLAVDLHELPCRVLFFKP